MATASKVGGTSQQGKGRMGRRRIEPDTTSYSRQIAARVRSLRERQGITVAELAAKLRVHEQTVYKWESGQNAVDLDKLPALFRALGCQRLSDFFPPLK